MHLRINGGSFAENQMAEQTVERPTDVGPTESSSSDDRRGDWDDGEHRSYTNDATSADVDIHVACAPSLQDRPAVLSRAHITSCRPLPQLIMNLPGHATQT